MRLMSRRASSAAAPKLVEQARKLDLFVIDSGCDAAMSELLRRSGAIAKLGIYHRVFVLTRQQSTEIIGKSEDLARRDPVLVLVNSDARVEKRRGSYGIRVCLGGLDGAAAATLLAALTEVASSSEETGDQVIAKLFRRLNNQAVSAR
jgi:hypothetical protein